MNPTFRRVFSILAACFLLGVLIFTVQARPVTARGLPAVEAQGPGGGFSVFLPFISNYPPNTISGRVTLAGAAAAGYELTLHRYRNLGNNEYEPLSFEQQVITDANGRYEFKNVAAPAADEVYFVWYLNVEGDGHCATCLSYWGCEPIFGSTAHGIDFDITDVYMPEVKGEQSFPVTFTWFARSTPGEKYAFRLYDPESDLKIEPVAAVVFEHQLTGLPQGFEYGTPYKWGVVVYAESRGYGLSRVYEITFAEAGSDLKVLSQTTPGGKSPAAFDLGALPLPKAP